ncbi:hypothetical protein JOC37_001498 [Desulfohalotomaculum tongense]|uniref:BofC C-terminal domain-containing protein n=1 Tax=Desulforadius tongensis TaxID=1216062 RepID=UPI0019580A4E|nr:BofC C-terminal domain-containing protein [Desulforadius tongensis]MBM7855113.1 hypothetical protein [Desulforadius tongensis]
MLWRRLILAAVSAFLVGVMVTSAYLATNAIFNWTNNTVVNPSWATEEAALENLVVTKRTKVYKQNIYLCGDAAELSVESGDALVGMGKDDLLNMFSAADGWQVRFDSPYQLVLARKVNALCPRHRHYRHLGIYNGKLAVFQGPLGVNTLLINVVENKPVEKLSRPLYQKLKQGMEFDKQKPELQAKLKQELEFAGDKELYAVLENIDELS